MEDPRGRGLTLVAELILYFECDPLNLLVCFPSASITIYLCLFGNENIGGESGGGTSTLLDKLWGPYCREKGPLSTCKEEVIQLIL